MKSTSKLAVAIAAGLFIGGASLTPATAADLGGDCCADLEERVADLEATTVRKGNRKVSVTLYGWVTRAIMVWDDGVDADAYAVGTTVSSSRFGLKGKANIGGGWSAGYKMEWETQDTREVNTSPANDDGIEAEGLALRQEFIYLKNASIGKFTIGHGSTPTTAIERIDLGGTNVIARSDVQFWVNGYGRIGGAAGTSFRPLISNLGTGRHDQLLRYDTPNFAGFVGAVSFGEDDFWSMALRYANEFGGTIRVAAGIGYSAFQDPGATIETVSGSASAMHVPTGLFLTVAAGQQESSAVANATDSYWYIKGGIKQKFTSWGATTLYGEYGDYDVNQVTVAAGTAFGDTGEVWGLGVIQNIDAAAMQVFAAYRNYSISTANSPDFSAALIGARIKF